MWKPNTGPTLVKGRPTTESKTKWCDSSMWFHGVRNSHSGTGPGFDSKATCRCRLAGLPAPAPPPSPPRRWTAAWAALPRPAAPAGSRQSRTSVQALYGRRAVPGTSPAGGIGAGSVAQAADQLPRLGKLMSHPGRHDRVAPGHRQQISSLKPICH